jgi:hypothetical protein
VTHAIPLHDKSAYIIQKLSTKMYLKVRTIIEELWLFDIIISFIGSIFELSNHIDCIKFCYSKQLPNCLKREETSVVLVIFNGVHCETSTYTVTVV